MSLAAEIQQVLDARNANIYSEWLGSKETKGKQYKNLSLDYDLSMSSIKRILVQYRIDHNLPNGRKHAMEMRA
jgi:Mor family transcriptional regulator